MSKTYRRDEVEMDCNCGAPIRPRYTYAKGVRDWSVQQEIKTAIRKGCPVERECDCHRKVDYFTKRNSKRDRKPWMKPKSNFKKMMRKARKAKVRAAMQHHDYDNIPRFRKEDMWNYH